MTENDVIAAIATAPGQAAIGIIRISGGDALDVLRRVFRPSAKFKSHKMYYGRIQSGRDIIDEVMVCPMLAPRSYTCEDTVEIYAHGGMLVLGRVLQTVIENGARLAHPGEFTRRAFLNGRINLSQAEAVMDIISAKSDAARRAGLRQLGGGLTARIENIRGKILSWLAHIELSIDYPEHEDEAKNAAEILSEGGEALAGLGRLLESAEVGRVLREGVKTAIIGRPNVGKSTLLNAILSEDRAIVHELPGTTRDILSEQVRIGDVPLMLMDTAGIRKTADPVEKIGVEKTYEAARDAELIIYVADISDPQTSEDEAILAELNLKGKLITLLNKADLPHSPRSAFENAIPISAKTGAGLDTLFSRVKELFLSGGAEAAEQDIVTRERHRVLIGQAIDHIKNAMREFEQNIPEDLVSINLRAAYMALGEILGVETGDDIVDRIFAEFCVGK